MAKINNTDIPENKFAEVTIGNNGVRIKQDDMTIYLKAEDIVEIFAKFIASPGNDNDEIETVYLDTNGQMVENIDEDSDIIMDANY